MAILYILYLNFSKLKEKKIFNLKIRNSVIDDLHFSSFIETAKKEQQNSPSMRKEERLRGEEKQK